MGVFINHVGTYNDHHKEYNIDARGKDLASILHACEAEEQEDLQRTKPEPEDVTPVQDNAPAPAQYCPYIQVDKLNDIGIYTPEQFNELTAKEAKKSAPKFAEFLHHHQKTGYLYFGKDSKQQVFDTLHAYYPTMKAYSYGNFALYF